MRSLQDTRQRWETWKEASSLEELKEGMKSEEAAKPCFVGLRSVCWKVFLLFRTVNRASWATLLTDSRDGYGALREHYLKDIEHPDEIESTADPLSDNEDSIWAVLRQDEDLRSEILQDVERCMPENLYFQQPSTQRILLDVLFVFCKLNPDIGYRQGMHELLAPVLWVVERDAIDSMTLDTPVESMEANDAQLLHLLDSNYIEHDTFSIFNTIMQSAKTFYEAKGSSENKPNIDPHNTKLQNGEAPIIARSNRIFKDYLPRLDPGLAAHLESLNISPQIFLMKWIRLLFGREFPLDDVLSMWDVLFAEDPSLELVNMICIAMMLRIRWQLLGSDVNTVLDLLLHYPQPSSGHLPQSFVLDAIYLRQNMSPRYGNVIIKKYSGKAPVLNDKSMDHENRQFKQGRKISSDLLDTAPESGRTPPRAGNLEYYLQDAARGIYAKGQKLGIRKAVQDAVGEVRKNVQAITSPESEGRSRQEPYNQSNPGPKNVLRRVSALQERNKALAKMLSSAVEELWEYEKNLALPENGEKKRETGKESLSATIAKVQFVQVFLEDPTIEVAAPGMLEAHQGKDGRLDDHEPNHSISSSSAGDNDRSGRHYPEQRNNITEVTPSRKAKDPLSKEKLSSDVVSEIPSIKIGRGAEPDSQTTKTVSEELCQPRGPRTPVNLFASRPSLAQSSFSWMVKKDTEGSSFVAASPTPTERRRGKGSRGFLFGEDDEVKGGGGGGGGGSVSASGSGANGERKPEVIGLDALK